MTSKKEKDEAREARSVACADAPGRDERAVLIGRAAIAAYDSYSRDIGMFDYTGYGAEKPYVIRDYRRECQAVLATDDKGVCEKEWERVVAEYVGLAMLKAARSESEDTQPKATPSQEDVDALVKAAKGATETMNSDGRICRDKAAKALRAALAPFQKG